MACVDKGGNKGFVVLLDRSCTVSRRLHAISAEAQNKQERLTSGAFANNLSQRLFPGLPGFLSAAADSLNSNTHYLASSSLISAK
jgi:hypothetical protein